MVRIEETGFGYIVINGKRFDHDVVIRTDGSIEARKKELSSRYKRFIGHTPLGPEEAIDLLRDQPEIVIIGTGQYGVLPIHEEAEKILSKSGARIIKLKTPDAIREYNKLSLKHRTTALFHVTC